MPTGARPVHVAMQSRKPCVWFEVSETARPESQNTRMMISGTGEVVPDNAEYIGSVHDEQFVWHVWHEVETPPTEQRS